MSKQFSYWETMVEDIEEKKKVGEVTHYFTNINVGVIELNDKLQVGDTISIEGETTNFQQEIGSMQIEHDDVESADSGELVGLKVKDRVREVDIVYKIVNQ